MHTHRVQLPWLYLACLLLAFFAVASGYVFEAVFVATPPLSASLLGLGTVSQFSLLFIAMLLAWWYGPNTQMISDYKLLLGVAVLLRVILLPIETYTSNDVSRYLFDGYIALNGMDPYRVSHDSPLLMSARENWSPPVEHLKYTTLYPPLALGLFSLAASAGAEYAFLAWKLMMTFASITTLIFGVLILKRAEKLQHLSLIALSPILILESSIGAHVDTFSALAVAIVIYTLQRKLLIGTGIIIGIGTLIKLLPVVLAFPIVLAVRNRCNVFFFLTGLLLTVASGYLVTLALGLHPIGSIGVFFEKFRFGSPYFYFLEQHIPLQQLVYMTACLAVIGFILIAYFTWTRSQSLLDKNTVLAMQASLCLPLLLSPVIYPWYLAPLVPLLALSPNKFVLTWMALLPLTYEVLGQFVCCNIWNPQSWPLIVIALGMLFSVLPTLITKAKQNMVTESLLK